MPEYIASSVAFSGCTLEDACDRIAALGLKGIDLWFVGGMCEHLPPDDRDLDLSRIRRALAGAGLTLHAMSVYGAAEDVALARLEQLKELGGTVLVRDAMASGKTNPQIVLDRTRAQREFAGKIGVTLAIENHTRTAFCTIDQMKHVIGAATGPEMSVAYAPIHTHCIGESIPGAIAAIADRTSLFYVWDWGPSSDENWKDPAEQLPGTGVLDFPSMFQALSDIKYNGIHCLFAHGLEFLPPDEAQDAMSRALAFCARVDERAAAAAS